MTQSLQDKLDRLPTNSGVYLMKDIHDKIIYVGKAVVLKNRVKQYFNNTQKAEKVAAMVAEVVDFEYIITNTEFDALSLEANLIKKYWPKYNILLKDDKRAPFIRVNLKDVYPVFEVVRKLKRDGAKYFGPFFFGIRVNDIIAVLKIVYQVRTCTRKMDKPSRACLDYHIKQCLAPCERLCTVIEYETAVQQAIAFLQGKEYSAKLKLQQMMEVAANNQDFENAILYRNQLNMLDNLNRKNIAELRTAVSLDVIAFASDGQYSVVSVLFVRYGKMLGIKNFVVVDVSINDDEYLYKFCTQFYHYNLDAPQEIVSSIPLSPDIAEFVYSFTKIRPILTVPKRGAKFDLLVTAQKNVDDYLLKSRTKEQVKRDMTVGAVSQLEQILGIKSARRMECYDISNISGTDKVASQTVFINGEPAKKQYRKYKIKTVEGSDDFASMRETLVRRFGRAKQGDDKFAELPDLIIIDGGKGQLSAAVDALVATGYGHLDIISLAKRDEEIYLPNCPDPIVLPKSHNSLKMLQRIRDEAHRFAITFHRQLRDKRMLESIEDKG
ncbi:MAG: excinuclease ABC subunit UvrC [Firmicutes bacterium]|nr:excinuclease ABC subunit UvrC [Bacillota bacterium]MCL1953544.1 excinuclease ABC subunit UvrC [Bacillota bacterium]